MLQEYLAKGHKKVCLLTATPRNKSAKDVLNQMKLFHPDSISQLPINPANLDDYFKLIEKGERRLQDLLMHILIRRTRNHILRFYGYTEDTDKPMRELTENQAREYLDGSKRAYVKVAGAHQFFPKRELETLRYSIEDTYSRGLYQKIRAYLGRPEEGSYTPVPGKELTYARYGIANYVIESKRDQSPYKELHSAGINLRGLIRVMLFKRFESSVEAFCKSLERMEGIHATFLRALDENIMPAGDDAQKLLYESDRYEETELMDSLEAVSGKYDIDDFDVPKLRAHLEADKAVLAEMLKLVKPITPEKDAKLQTLLKGLEGKIPQATGKVLIFTQFADTAAYLSSNLNPGRSKSDIDSIYGTDKSKARMAARFSPRSNPHLSVSDDSEVRILIATDVMSEGLNLQDGDVLVNYDLHWNPVRLIQRFGRIDRIGGTNDRIWGFNFLPETEMEKQLGLKEVLDRRISEIHETIGEDAAILDKAEQLNDKAMFCIYEQNGGQLSLFEEDEGGFVDINEAEELLRSLKVEDPAEFDRIAALRDGIRSARSAGDSGKGRFVFCQAGKYQKLYMTDESGVPESGDVPEVLGRLKCTKNEVTQKFTPDFNRQVSEVLDEFRHEVEQLDAQKQHSLSLTTGQSYVLRELRSVYSGLEDEDNDDLRRQIQLLEDSFRQPVTSAIKRQLNVMRRNGVSGAALTQGLSDLYHDHEMGTDHFQIRNQGQRQSDALPRIICSEAFV